MSKRTAKIIRIALLVIWLVFLAVLLVLIRYAQANTAMQGFVTTMVKAYMWGSVVVIAVQQWLRRKKE